MVDCRLHVSTVLRMLSSGRDPGALIDYIHVPFQIHSFRIQFQNGHSLTIDSAMVGNSGEYSCRYVRGDGAVAMSRTEITISRECGCV